MDVSSASNVPLVFCVSVRVFGATAVPVISAALARTLDSESSMRMYTKGALRCIVVPLAVKAYLSGTTKQSCWTELYLCEAPTSDSQIKELRSHESCGLRQSALTQKRA